MKNVLIVESPAKARTISRYLGPEFTVLASYGHIRDLPAKKGSVLPEEDFKMLWEVDPKAKKYIDAIAKELKSAQALYLATDPDREGEAISWHVVQVLQETGKLKNTPVKRIVFYEVTPKAVKEALKHPRDIHQPLVEAYLARRALDYLVGFNLSPILWRKLPGARSAGRVQSVALRLIVEREHEVEVFQPQEYWSITGSFLSSKKEPFNAKLTHLQGKKLDKFSLANKQLADEALAIVQAHTYSIKSVERRQVNRSPAPPFSTSTLQQEASRKLGFSARKTMQTAQLLYEGIDIGGETTGLITYMRTDSVQMAKDALDHARSYIQETYGNKYLPAAPRQFKSKAKNAQEAHEAIRPTVLSRSPQEVKPYLDHSHFNLYELIWKRAMASQMANAVFDQVGVDLHSGDQKTILRATGSVLVFDGFLILYQEGKDEGEETEEGRMLPLLNEGEKAALKNAISTQHFTQPPPRYTEASLVKKLEELGIGRPSTYASILSVLQQRDYARLEKRQFIPEERGRLVTVFLLGFFNRYIEYDFTASLEEQLDEISAGDRSWQEVIRAFWQPFFTTVSQTEKLPQPEVLASIEQNFAGLLSPEGISPDHQCPVCKEGTIHLKVSKFGAFLGCTNYPECNYRRPLTMDHTAQEKLANPVVVGVDPDTAEEITLRKGPYGFYLQWGGDVAALKPKTKPKRITIPPILDHTKITLAQAMQLKALPKNLGLSREHGEEIIVSIGRFGPYVKCDKIFASIPKNLDFLAIDLKTAIELIKKKLEKKPTQQPLKRKRLSRTAANRES